MDPQNWRIGNVFQWRDPSYFVWGPWKFKWWEPRTLNKKCLPRALNSFLHTDMTQVVETLLHVRQDHTYSTKSISWVLMSWRHKEPGNQQQWYWLLWTLKIWFTHFNTLRPKQHGRHFADDTFKSIFLNEDVRISIENSMKFVPNGTVNNIPTLIQIMAWRRPGDKPLSELMLTASRGF